MNQRRMDDKLLMKIQYENNIKIPDAIARSFKLLFEAKHLYQNIKIDLSVFRRKRMHSSGGIGAGVSKDHDESKEVDFSLMPDHLWRLTPSKEKKQNKYVVSMPHIEIFCSVDSKAEPFHPKEACTISHSELRDLIIQDYIVSYECQLCKTLVTFMVRREGLKLLLSGRSPMEAVHLPTYIPKNQKQYISDAIIAYNSGQTLPALFMLRVFIEQYAKSFSSIPDLKADKYIEKYMKSLSQEFKAKYPSVSDLYEKLSLAIHKADASSELFVKTMDNICIHLEAKQLEEKIRKSKLIDYSKGT